MKKISNLKKIREKQGLTVAELSRRSGICAKTISEIEKGSTNSRKETKYRILNALNRERGKKITYTQVFGRD